MIGGKKAIHHYNCHEDHLENTCQNCLLNVYINLLHKEVISTISSFLQLYVPTLLTFYAMLILTLIYELKERKVGAGCIPRFKLFG